MPIGAAAGGAILGALIMPVFAAAVGISSAGPVAGGAFAAAQSAGWMSVPGVSALMAGT